MASRKWTLVTAECYRFNFFSRKSFKRKNQFCRNKALKTISNAVGYMVEECLIVLSFEALAAGIRTRSAESSVPTYWTSVTKREGNVCDITRLPGYRLRSYSAENAQREDRDDILRDRRHTADVVVPVQHRRHHGALVSVSVLEGLLLHVHQTTEARAILEEVA